MSLQAINGQAAPALCPQATKLVVQPAALLDGSFGNGCEPPWTRGAIQMVRHLLAARGGGVGVEWGGGPSTLWLLSGMLTQLETVEHSPEAAAQLKSLLQEALPEPELSERWQMHVRPPAAPVKTFLQAESYEHYFKEYVDTQLELQGGYDVVAVHGMASLGVLRRAVDILRPDGGILVLAHSQRRQYRGAMAVVPQRWHSHTVTSLNISTTVWVSCTVETC